jgi:hypothetical protein
MQEGELEQYWKAITDWEGWWRDIKTVFGGGSDDPNDFLYKERVQHAFNQGVLRPTEHAVEIATVGRVGSLTAGLRGARGLLLRNGAMGTALALEQEGFDWLIEGEVPSATDVAQKSAIYAGTGVVFEGVLVIGANAFRFLGREAAATASTAERTLVVNPATGKAEVLQPLSTVKVYRVEGTPNTRILIGERGEVVVLDNESMLFLNFGSAKRAQEFAAQKAAQGMPGLQIKSFRVQRTFLDELREAAVPQLHATRFPVGTPQIVDVSKAPDQFGLTAEWIDRLRSVITEGTGASRPFLAGPR